jgi:acyl-coenzyme A thioesterase PaaI-like protein
LTSEALGTAGRYEVAPHACFACGDLNSHGLRLRLHAAGPTCWTEITLTPDFQGWEGITHGGIVATILDEVMAWSLASADAWGFTARMSIEYRKPTPIGRPIRAEGRITDRRRRVMETAATLVDAESGDVLATATGTYVAAPADRQAMLKERYQFRLVPEEGER